MQTPKTKEDDWVLIRRVAARDRQAFETLYYRYAPRIYRYLSSLIRQRETIEETVNDVMMVVWEKASQFDGTSQLSTWMLGIAHYKALKARARTARADPDVAETKPGADNRGPQDAVARRELSGIVAGVLASLSPEQKAVVELTFYHDLSYAEIAEIVGCPVNTVKTRMLHARRRLALLLDNDSISQLRGLDDVRAE